MKKKLLILPVFIAVLINILFIGNMFTVNSYAKTVSDSGEKKSVVEAVSDAIDSIYASESLDLEHITWDKFQKDPQTYIDAAFPDKTAEEILRSQGFSQEVFGDGKWGKELFKGNFAHIIEEGNKGLHKPVTWIYMADGFEIPLLNHFLTFSGGDLSIAKNIYNFFLPLGVIMLVMYFALDLTNISVYRVRQYDVKALIMSFIKLAFGYALLIFAPHIIGALMNMNNAIMNAVLSGKVSFDTTTSLTPQMQVARYLVTQSIINNMNFMECLALVVVAPLIFLASVVPQIVLMVQAMSRKVELVLRCGFAPVACTDIYNGVSNSNALKYFKKMGVVILHGFAMVAIIQICYKYQQQDTMYMITWIQKSKSATEALPGLVQVLESLVYSFVAIGLITSSKQIVSDAIGV